MRLACVDFAQANFIQYTNPVTNMIVIQNAQQWASSQGYSLLPSYNKSYLVSRSGAPVGALLPIAQGYKFVSCDTPSFRASQESSLCADTPMIEIPETFQSKSFGLSDLLPYSLEREKKNSKEIILPEQVSGTGVSERISDCNYWLPYAAEHYCLSRDIRDYVLVPIPAIFSDLPNTNGDGLSLKQMLRFDPEFGMQMYKTFKGKPTHVEHQNKDITQAKGVILDSFLRPVPFNRKYYKIVLLLAYDRTKDSALAESILRNESNAYSVGFYYKSYSCSVCGTRVGRGINLSPCSHTQMGKPTYQQADGKIVYRKCEDGVGFECSSVTTPAFVSAIGPTVYDARNF